MNEIRGSMVCAAKNCPSARRSCKLSFFRFPTDLKRAEMWLIACGREDLRQKMDKLSSYRLCSIHFREDMYTNGLRNRLLPTAMPTLFIKMANPLSVAIEHNYCIQ